MHRLSKFRFSHLNLTQKLTGYILLTSVIPLILIGVVSYQVSRGILKQLSTSYNQQLVEDQTAYLDVNLQGIESLIVNISGVEEIATVMSDRNAPADTYTDLATQARIGYILNNYSNIKGLVSIDLFAANGVHYHVGDTLNAQNTRNDVKDEIISRVEKSGQEIDWIGVIDNVNADSKQKTVISAARLYNNLALKDESDEKTALLVVSYDPLEFYNHFIDVNSGPGSYIMVIDANGRVIFHPTSDLIGHQVNSGFVQKMTAEKGSFETSVEGEPMLVTYTTSPISQWKIVHFLPLTALTSQAFPIAITTLIIVLICLIEVFILTAWYNNSVVMPIRTITEAFRMEQQGRPGQLARLKNRSQDELGELIRWFNAFLDSRAAQKEAEEALRQSERYATMLNSITMAALKTSDLKIILNTIAHFLGESVNADGCLIRMSKTTFNDHDISAAWTKDENLIANYFSGFDQLTGSILSTGERIIYNDQVEIRLSQVAPDCSVQALVGLPLESMNDPFGAVVIAYNQAHYFNPDEIEFAIQAAAQISLAVAKALLLEESQSRAHVFETLYQTAHEITNIEQLEILLEKIVQQAAGLLQVSGSFVYLQNKATGFLELNAFHGIALPIASITDFTTNPAWAGLRDQQSVAINDYRALAKGQQILGDAPINNLALVPMIWSGEMIGVLGVADTSAPGHRFDVSDLRTLSLLARLGTSALNSTLMFHEVRQFNEELEKGIEERTRLLEETNRELEAEIKERRSAEEALKEERASLSRRVSERTQELSAANAQLGRAVRAKDEFLANMSHELRTPLNAILGLSEALEDQVYGSLNDQQLKSLHTIEESGHHLLSLINDILDLSKIEAGKLELQTGWVNVPEICEASLQFVKQQALKKCITISLNVDYSIDAVWADDRRLKQVLVNLLTNAVKFTPEHGSIGLEVKRNDQQDAVDFTVWDTGIGISPEDQDRLFKPFVQIDSGLARYHEGTGLGLALVSRISEMHGGSVTLASQPGQGSRFTVTLPWQESHLNVIEVQPDTNSQPEPEIYNVLYIEDTPTSADIMSHYAADAHVHLTAHNTGIDAVSTAIALQPDVIFLDLLLPDISGWEVLSQLKSHPETRNIPVVIASVIDERARGMASGAADYLIKPISRQDFLRGLTRAARAKPTHSLSMPEINPNGSLILLAEDNEANVETISDYLRAKGYQIAAAHNGAEAVAQAIAAHPALILMDVQMPGMDGLEATRRIRGNPAIAAIPIIALTALAMPGDRERCLSAGANDYLSKPIGLKKLVSIIQMYLPNH
jgi:signal transduction histidine kinase/CheY-like chemotaxis protein